MSEETTLWDIYRMANRRRASIVVDVPSWRTQRRVRVQPSLYKGLVGILAITDDGQRADPLYISPDEARATPATRVEATAATS